jgi:prevent-host-death family protein
VTRRSAEFLSTTEDVVKKIGAAKFKEQCLSFLDRLTPEGIIITKHGRPVARVIPLHCPSAGLIGSLRGRIEVGGEILSTEVAWDADDRP